MYMYNIVMYMYMQEVLQVQIKLHNSDTTLSLKYCGSGLVILYIRLHCTMSESLDSVSFYRLSIECAK